MSQLQTGCGGFVTSRWRKDDGGIIAGLLVLVLAVAVAYGGYVGYQYWHDNQNTTPPPAAVPQGSEQLSGNGVTLVIPRGWSKASLRENQVQIKDPVGEHHARRRRCTPS
ncbi:MAG: hypothetical protein LH645_10750 [Actinomycetia bacterium]|nr:hypothetical protein [Actinomycetes bacterium]